MSMIAKTLTQRSKRPFGTLRAIALGLSLSFTAPAFADNLPEVQRLIKQGQFPQALEKVDSYLSSRPKDAQGRFIKGLILTEMGKPNDAIALFTKLTEDYPELPEPYNNLAVLYAQQKKYDRARTALEMAIRTHPSYTIAYENLGDIYAKLASQAYDKALQLDRENPAAQNKLALIRDLISTSTKGNVKPTPKPAAPSAQAAVAPAAVVASAPTTAAANKPAAAPMASPAAPATASVVATTTGAAATMGSAPAASTTAPALSEEKSLQGAEADLKKAIEDWAAAWSRKDMKAYFAAYASEFDPKGNQSRKSWEEERKKRIAGKSGKIRVSISDPKFTIDGNQATVKFHQSYRAPGLSSDSTKTLILVRKGERWLIKEENTR